MADPGIGQGTKEHPLYCSFCGKANREVLKMIAGPTVFICNECVGICVAIIDEEPIHALKSFVAALPMKPLTKEDRAALIALLPKET